MPNQQQGGGGLFARYQGEQVQQIPPGYMESMAAMGQAYANIGKSLAEGFKAKADRDLKIKEIESNTKTANVKEQANTLAAEKNEDTFNIGMENAKTTANESRGKLLSETYSTLSEARESVRTELTDINKSLESKDLDETTRKELQRRKSLRTQDLFDFNERLRTVARQHYDISTTGRTFPSKARAEQPGDMIRLPEFRGNFSIGKRNPGAGVNPSSR